MRRRGWLTMELTGVGLGDREIAAGIEKVIKKEASHKRFSSMILHTAAEYNWDGIVEKIRSIYEGCIEK